MKRLCKLCGYWFTPEDRRDHTCGCEDEAVTGWPEETPWEPPKEEEKP